MTTTNPVPASKFGARVFLLNPETVFVVQTVKKGKQQNSPYVLDKNAKTTRFINIIDEKGIADAIREALKGHL